MMGVAYLCNVFFVQAEDGIRDLVRSRGLGDVYKRQSMPWIRSASHSSADSSPSPAARNSAT